MQDEKMGKVKGRVVDAKSNNPIELASVVLIGTELGATTDEDGAFEINNVPEASYVLQVQFVGYNVQKQKIDVFENSVAEVVVKLSGVSVMSEKLVVTGTRSEKFKRDVPVIVNVVDSKMMEVTQSLNLAEGLNYQPAVRVENNCQNCGFNQVRMNGLEGPYSQILVNSRPIISALAGVYGLEHFPSIMIDRVEVARGGGSALYGGNAIAGTINIITKTPHENSFEMSTNTAYIDGEIPDNQVNMASSLVSDNRTLGMFLFGNYRDRNHYDANGDGYSELAELEDIAVGLRGFYLPSDLSRLEAEFHVSYEDRRGGNDFDLEPHQADVTEATQHTGLNGSVNYEQYLSSDYLSKVAVYASLRHTDRDSYYGSGEDPNAYGQSEDLVFVGGAHYSKTFDGLWGEKSEFIFGAETQYNELEDSQPAYERYIDQYIRQYGFFVQDDWKVSQMLSLLLGARVDKHSEIDNLIFNPRLSLMVNISPELQFRSTVATGFRAPQTFDEDLHIEGVGGNQQIIQNADDLKEERSLSWSSSFDYTVRGIGYEWGFTLEGFYTKLYDAFSLEDMGTSNGVQILERHNADGATVFGGTLEGRYLKPYWQFQAGLTVQSSKYDNPVEWSEEKPELATDEFLHTPSVYGYFQSSWDVLPTVTLGLSGIYTGTMKLAHYAGYIAEDRLEESDPFFELNAKLTYHFAFHENFSHEGFDVSLGVQNIFNSYQDDFDKGADRDAGYIYGPARPRTFFVATKLHF
ncbi:TonB-dependent receptor [Chloroherpeton thalassium]|nr:TonB-dependent receptor [Chloroherpeton thalassium]